MSSQYPCSPLMDLSWDFVSCLGIQDGTQTLNKYLSRECMHVDLFRCFLLKENLPKRKHGL